MPRHLLSRALALCTSSILIGLTGCGDIQVNGSPDETGGKDASLGDPGPDVTARECETGKHSQCDDGNSCTEDKCVDRVCVNTERTNVCNIGDECFANLETKADNACLMCDLSRSATSWSEVGCDDGNPCTTDACDFKEGCQHITLPNGQACDDGNPCSQDDACQEGQCVGTCACQADADCAEMQVGPCEKAVCSNNQCVATSDLSRDGQSCSSGDKCVTGETCSAGACTGGAPVDCAASGDGVCTLGVCNPDTGGCTAKPAEAGTACDDGDACTVNDVCGAEGCAGVPLDCKAFDGPCTMGKCVSGQCLADVKVGQSCDHANPCVIGATCLSDGSCQGQWDTSGECACTSNLDCKDNLGCTQEVCNVETGECTFPVVGGTCFINGKCYFAEDVNPLNSCQRCDPAEPTVWSSSACDDGNPCTVDTCDPLTGCSFQPQQGLECDDGDPCTKNEMCNDKGQCVGTCECKFDADCASVQVAAGPCERVACVGFTCVAVPDAAKNGTACDDGDLCTIGEVCQAGACVGGVAVTCEPGDPAGCETTACDPTTGQCKSTPKAAATQCDDKDPCTLTDQCDATGTCVGVPLDCSEFDDACNAGSCVAGQCITSPRAGEPCDDGEACTTDDQCTDSGDCKGNWDAELQDCGCQDDAWCDDGLGCTVDACSNEKKCIYTVKDGFCAIGKTCFAAGTVNPNNACQVCQPSVSKSNWQSLSCDDGNPCTDDTCNTMSGCTSVADDTNTCNDGNLCTKNDHCEAGACVGDCGCMIDADCTGTPSACTKFVCQNYECVEVADASQDGEPCDDGLFCTNGDVCQSGVCKAGPARDCSAAGDGKCTVGACDEVGDKCVPQPAPDGNACDDGNPCTQDDACSGGVCKGTELDCSAYADQCNSAACVAGSCKKTPLTGASCDDGDAECTINDKCTAGGVCVGSWNCGCQSDAECGAYGDTCNAGRCDVTSGECYKEPKVGAACDDGLPCTAGDQCDATGKCTGTSYSCDDGLTCTDDVCDGAGGCANPVKSGQCLVGGKCYNGGQLNPDNACQKCVSGTSWANNDGVACDDKLACTKGDVCSAGQCVGAAYTCDDGLACTTDGCDGAGGCTHTIGQGYCVIAGACVTAGTPNPNNPCQSCQPAKSQSAWSNNNDPCDDGQPCTHSDVCNAGVCAGTPYACNDGKGCTTDTCDGKGGCTFPIAAGSCLINTTCYAAGASNPANSCEHCVPSSSQTAWSSKEAGTACNDGLSCTENDACNPSGQCVGSLAGCSALQCETATCTEDGCLITLKAGYCKIDGVCYVDGASDGNNTCRRCDVKSSTTKWTNVTGSCDDGAACTSGDKCTDGTCGGTPYDCDDGLACTTDLCDGVGNCKHTQQPSTCLIDGKCYKDGDLNPSNSCQVCDAANSKSTWSNVANGTPCTDDGLSCTLDTCSQGQCTHPHDASSGACLIGGACYANLASNPANDCQRCDVANSGSTWSPKPAGAACGDDGNPCTDDVCNGKSICTHPVKPNFSACDDKKPTTYGDWCYESVCRGFTLALSSSNASGQDEFVQASPGPNGDTYATYVAGALINANTYTAHYAGGTSALATNLVGKLAQKDVLGSNFLIHGSSLRQWDPNTSSWVTSTTTGTLSQAFNSLANGSWGGAVSWTQIGGVCFPPPCTTIQTIRKFAGRTADDKAMIVRGCTTVNGITSCTDEVVADKDEFPFAVVRASSQPIIVANYLNETTPNYVDFLRFDSTSTTWKLLTYVVTSGAAGRAAYSTNTGVVVAGDSGLLTYMTVEPTVTKIAIPGFSEQPTTTFTDITSGYGHVFVLGSFEKAPARYFVIAYASLESNLAQSSSWKVHFFATGNTKCVPGEYCPSFSDYKINAIEARPEEMFLFGGWPNTSSKQMDKALWRWVP